MSRTDTVFFETEPKEDALFNLLAQMIILELNSSEKYLKVEHLQ